MAPNPKLSGYELQDWRLEHCRRLLTEAGIPVRGEDPQEPLDLVDGSGRPCPQTVAYFLLTAGMVLRIAYVGDQLLVDFTQASFSGMFKKPEGVFVDFREHYAMTTEEHEEALMDALSQALYPHGWSVDPEMA